MALHRHLHTHRRITIFLFIYLFIVSIVTTSHSPQQHTTASRIHNAPPLHEAKAPPLAGQNKPHTPHLLKPGTMSRPRLSQTSLATAPPPPPPPPLSSPPLPIEAVPRQAHAPRALLELADLTILAAGLPARACQCRLRIRYTTYTAQP
ncbi:hypothetical protein XA68_17178 [Ophiocordyceps unilateralis]|uniref:Uncharacterized protein n=1 Tax=Ophiocordyceps unilateralis TaxID=268505 RepID=A0A2A9P4X7_OPHUN|nr:hypothetical protein XA68_17178 [Ophiocordyceps unilateralis]